MTKKDFILIAKVIRKAYDEAHIQDDVATVVTTTGLAYDFALALRANNVNFDRDKFLIAAIERS